MANIVNIANLTYMDFGDGGKFGAKLGRIGPDAGAKKLGYNLTVVEPGKRAFPYHIHHSNEEMFFIVEGAGTLRFGAKEYPLRAGDIIACPPGPGHAHQIINSSKGVLKYLAVSTSQGPEIAEYPDSGKVGILCGTFEKPDLRLFVKKASGVDFFEGESD
jgi:uncharacterized cupin superfamily protein